MHLKLLFFLLLFAGATTLTAQRGSRKAIVNKKWLAGQDSTTQDSVAGLARLYGYDPLKRGWSVHVNPFPDLGSRLWSAGFQYKRGRNSFLLDTRFRGRAGEDNTTNIRNIRVFDLTFHPEFRYDISPRRGWYIGIVLPLNVSRTRFELDRLVREELTLVENTERRELAIGLVPKIGGQFLIWQHLLIDGYVGLGGEREWIKREGFTRLETINSAPGDRREVDTRDANNWFRLMAGVRLGWWF